MRSTDSADFLRRSDISKSYASSKIRLLGWSSGSAAARPSSHGASSSSASRLLVRFTHHHVIVTTMTAVTTPTSITSTSLAVESGRGSGSSGTAASTMVAMQLCKLSQSATRFLFLHTSPDISTTFRFIEVLQSASVWPPVVVYVHTEALASLSRFVHRHADRLAHIASNG